MEDYRAVRGLSRHDAVPGAAAEEALGGVRSRSGVLVRGVGVVGVGVG